MKFCTKCGAQLKDEAQFCNKCGAPCTSATEAKENTPLKSGEPSEADSAIPKENSEETAKKQPEEENKVKETVVETAKSPAAPAKAEGKNEKKSSKLPLIIGILAVIIIAVVVIVLTKKKPEAQNTETVSANVETTVEETEKVTEPEPEEKKEETPAESVPENSDADRFVKYWMGSEHWGYEITKEPDGSFTVILDSSEGYRQHSTETMHCTYSNGRLEYTDAVLEREIYSLDESCSEPARITEYTNGQGYFELLDEVENPGENEYLETPEETTIILGGVPFDEESMKPPYIAHTYKTTPCASEEYMIWYSDQVPLMDEDFGNMDAMDVKIARNEIFARHGRLFKDEELQNHFNSCGWYNGTVPPEQFSEDVLSEVERNNIKVIEKYEANTDFSLITKLESSAEDCYKKYGADREKYGLTVSSYDNAQMLDKGSYYELPYAEMFIYEAPIPESVFAGKGPGDSITWKGYTYIIESTYDNEYGKGFSFVENLSVTDVLGAHKVDGGYRLNCLDDYSPTTTVFYGSVKFDKDCVVYGYGDFGQCSIKEYALTNHSFDENRFEQGFEYGLTDGYLRIYGYIVKMENGLVTEFKEIFTS